MNTQENRGRRNSTGVLASSARGRGPEKRRARRPRTALERQLEEEVSLITHSSSALVLEYPGGSDEFTVRISSFSKLVPGRDVAPRARLESTLLNHPLIINLRYGAEKAVVGDQQIWAMTPAGTAYGMRFELEEWAEEFIAGGWTPRWVRFHKHVFVQVPGGHDVHVPRPELLEEI